MQAPVGGEVAVARFGDGLVRADDGPGLPTRLAEAAQRAARTALARLGTTPTLAAVFVSCEDPEAAAAALSAAHGMLAGGPGCVVVGASVPGVIGDGRAVEAAPAVSVWSAALPGAHLRAFHLEVLRLPEGMAVVGLPEREPTDVVGVVLADPFSFPVDGFVKRSNDSLAGLPLVGGIAMGQRGPGSTRLLLDGRVVDRGAVGVVLGGPLGVRPVVSQGCRPVGPTMAVTRCAGNVVLELAGVPALDKLEQIVSALDVREQDLVRAGLQFGIAMDEYADDHDQGDFLVRPVLGVDRDQRGVVVGEIVEVGRTVRFQVRDSAAASADLDRTLDRFQADVALGGAGGALLFSCNGRGAHLFGAADHDVRAVRRVLGIEAVAGCFAGGEIGPVGARNHLHGFTASVLAFGAEP